MKQKMKTKIFPENGPNHQIPNSYKHLTLTKTPNKMNTQNKSVNRIKPKEL